MTRSHPHHLNPDHPSPTDQELAAMPIPARNALLEELRQDAMGPSTDDGHRFHANYLPADEDARMNAAERGLGW